MEDMMINMALAILLGVIKNKAKAAKLKAGLIKLRNAINVAFPNE